MTLRRLIYLFSTAWLLVILLIVNISIYFLFYKIATDSELNRMMSQTKNIATAVNPGNNVAPADLLRAYLPANGMIRVVNRHSQPILTATKSTEMTDLAPKFQSSQSTGLQKVKGETYGVVSVPIIWNDGRVVTLEVTENLHEIGNNLNVLKVVLAIAFFVVMIPSILGGRLLGNILLRPINSMIHTMNDIQQSGTFKKIPLREKQQDELHKMAHTFNHTMDILEDNFEKQRAFVSDASHELKTPLTVIESYASLLKRWGMKKPEVLEEAIDAIHSETVRMKEMTTQMLQLAESDEDLNVKYSSVDLVELCENVGRIFENTYHREVHIEASGKHVRTRADESKLKQLLFIFLDNAWKYSSEAIEVQVGREGEHVFFAVHDHGIGIPEDEVAHVFDRFFRVDKARSRTTGGTGLGLAIAKQIVDVHQGSIKLESVEGVGTKVTVIFPALSNN
ncbi:HAMP domain-containing sensor histidine kinase [Numidum massiliense]|uniref:HAMP domain-containing sensor histidine kinase n=1 Tax=Numidum massiliense TaxID=1522315 RepID=UPI0006D575D6|nr:HAMP domain-containing histidine kinase [Numidum massiliense]